LAHSRCAASITYGCPTVTAASYSAADVEAAIDALIGTLQAAAQVPLSSLQFITSTTIGLNLSSLRFPNGELALPGVGLGGGQIKVAELVTSNWAGPQVVALAGDHLLSATGGLEIETSREGSLEMVDSPVGDSGVPTPAATMGALALGFAIYWVIEQVLLASGIHILEVAAVWLSPISIFGWLAYGVLAVGAYLVLGRTHRRWPSRKLP
jgi:hypothetical protein